MKEYCGITAARVPSRNARAAQQDQLARSRAEHEAVDRQAKMRGERLPQVVAVGVRIAAEVLAVTSQRCARKR